MDTKSLTVKVYSSKEKRTVIYEEKMNRKYCITNIVILNARRLKEKLIGNPSVKLNFLFGLSLDSNMS